MKTENETKGFPMNDKHTEILDIEIPKSGCDWLQENKDQYQRVIDAVIVSSEIIAMYSCGTCEDHQPMNHFGDTALRAVNDLCKMRGLEPIPDDAALVLRCFFQSVFIKLLHKPSFKKFLNSIGQDFERAESFGVFSDIEL